MGVEGAASRGSSPATRGGRRLRDRHQRGRGLIPGYAGRTRARSRTWAHPRAHPRLRGEDTGYRPPERALVDSSPATRGGRILVLRPLSNLGLIPGYAGRTQVSATHLQGEEAHPRLRGEDSSTTPLPPPAGLIPGYAGRTSYATPCGPRPGAHPRLRGEDPQHPRARRPPLGSSPATRGGLLDPVVHRNFEGLIPGYAGRTAEPIGAGRGRRAHPRLRGEDTMTTPTAELAAGSSPATRGGLRLGAGQVLVGGLIPGYAGRTSSPRASRAVPAAHPRLRGEDLRVRVHAGIGRGSSPATRGGRRRGLDDGPRIGLIPGYAGRTSTRTTSTRNPSAHPRLRGEDWSKPVTKLVPVGSSPATRGGRADTHDDVGAQGLIPGYAGRTLRSAGTTCMTWAHPRLRGEDRPADQPERLESGSSPATRGGRTVRCDRPRHPGLIPGYAGRTLTSSAVW